MPRGKESSPSDVVLGQVACQMTRDEMKLLFEQSGYGSNTALFEAYFVKNSRPPICAVCGNTIHLHTNIPKEGEVRATANATGVQQNHEQQQAEQPDKTISELQNLIAARAMLKGKEYPTPYPMPPHWRDSAFRVFSYYNFQETEIVFRHNQSPIVKAVWRCTAGQVDQSNPCEYTIKTDSLQNALVPYQKEGGGAFKVHKEPHFKILEPSAIELNALRDHLWLAHGINVDSVVESGSPRGRWGSTLFDCAKHPRSCQDCLLCYPCGVSWCCLTVDLLSSEDCMLLRLNRLTHHTASECVPCLFCQPYQPKEGFIVRGHNPYESLCNGRDAAAFLVLGSFLFLGFWIVTAPTVFVSQLLTATFTLCGLPCRDMPPALHNDCYQHRRYLVEQQGIPESHLQSKLITLLCWPCSECQVWREFNHNGIWPGLCLFSGTRSDQAALINEARRLALTRRLTGPLGPSAMGSPLTAQIGSCAAE